MNSSIPIASRRSSVSFQYWGCSICAVLYGITFGIDSGAPFVAALWVISAIEDRT